MQTRVLVVATLLLTAGTAMAESAGPHLLRDGRGKVAGVTGVGTPCDPADSQCAPYTSTGVVTRVDREKDGTLASFALQLPSGNIDLQNFNDGQISLGRGDWRDLARWLRPGLRVTVTGTGTGDPDGAVVDRVVEGADQ
jgi:hypothetical protein